MLSRGDMVKDYEIVAPLRSGGMALLYLARRSGVGGFKRLVVLKLLHPELAESERITALFLAEARMCAQIAHPNVVHVEEVGELDGRYFLAMEYVHGVSLAELLAELSDRRLRMETKLCVWIVAQIAEALHAVHEARSDHDKPLRIVHSDVSPQNVLIGSTGHVKLIDFGIAKSRHDADDGPALLGKLGYMAPEQLSLAPIDRRTDVYALGIMLWEMLSARSLFRCQRLDDERDWDTRENPPSVSEFSLASDELARVVRKALEPNPALRYSSALAFRAELLRAEPEALQVDPPRLASFMHSLVGEELKRQRDSWPLDISAPLERGEQTIQFSHETSEEYDTATRVRDAQWLFDDEPVGYEDTSVERRAIPELEPPAAFGEDDDSNTEVWSTSRALEPAQARPSAPPGAAHRQWGRPASWLSLGMLCVALAVVITDRIHGEPVGTVHRLPSAVFHEPEQLLTSGQPEAGLQSYPPTAAKRELVLAVRDAGTRSAHRAAKHASYKQPKAHSKRSRH